MVRDVYEITVELENGDWVYIQVDATDKFDFHQAAAAGLDFAYQRKGKLIRLQKIGVASPAEG